MGESAMLQDDNYDLVVRLFEGIVHRRTAFVQDLSNGSCFTIEPLGTDPEFLLSVRSHSSSKLADQNYTIHIDEAGRRVEVLSFVEGDTVCNREGPDGEHSLDIMFNKWILIYEVLAESR